MKIYQFLRKAFAPLSIALVLSFMSFDTSVAQNADDVVGVWLTDGGKSKVEIYKKGDEYFGKIIWLREPNENGKPKVDKNNPDDDLKSRPLVGMELLSDFEFDDDEWEDGEIYDPESGKTYSCEMTLDGNTLNVRGYIGVSWVGRTTEWTRSSK